MKQMILLVLMVCLSIVSSFAQEGAYHRRHERQNTYYHKGHYRHHPHNFGRFHHPYHGRSTTGVECTVPLPRARVSEAHKPCSSSCRSHCGS